METRLDMVRKINRKGITILFIEHVMSALQSFAAGLSLLKKAT
jgi:ABC-type branched-subunit amino acid transport system ATPase component